MSMNPEIKVQWLAALRSDEYEQGRAQLTTVQPDESEQHCCLGVLCKLAEKAGIITSDVRVGRRYYGPDRVWAYAPKEVIAWAGLDEHKGDHYPPEYAEHNIMIGDASAGQLNDERRYTFPQIADEIEKHL